MYYGKRTGPPQIRPLHFPAMLRRRDIGFLYGFAGELGPDGRYVPDVSQILKTQPRFNTFYRADKSRPDVTVAAIAEAARKAAGLTEQKWTANTVKAIAANTWNRHIKYTTKGYEYLKIEGPENLRKYSLDPRASVNSGNEYPVIWVPDPRDAKEPEEAGLPITPKPPEPKPPEPKPPEPKPPEPSPVPGQGPKGDKGDPGRPPTAEEIAKAVAEYMKAHPAPRGEPGPPGEIGPPGPATQGPKGDPGPPGTASQEVIAIEVQKYLAAHPSAAGPQGPPGIPGSPGAPGRPPTKDEIKIAVAEYMELNPVETGKIPPELIAANVENYIKTHPELFTGGGPGAMGPPGAPGRPPTEAEISKAVAAWMDAHPLEPGAKPAGEGGGKLGFLGPGLLFGALAAISKATGS